MTQNFGFIYGIRSGDGPIRYVGQSINPQQRFESITDVRKGTSCGGLMKMWIVRNLDANFVILERCEQAQMDEREKYWIAEYRRDGHALMNVQDGGYCKYKDQKSVVQQMENLRDQWRTCKSYPPEREDIEALEYLLRTSKRKLSRIKKKRQKAKRASAA